MSAKDKKVSEIVLEERKIKALEKIAASILKAQVKNR